jgi:hypothetical protein
MKDAKKSVTFESFPSVLHLQLKRFQYDIQKDLMIKVTYLKNMYRLLLCIIVKNYFFLLIFFIRSMTVLNIQWKLI